MTSKAAPLLARDEIVNELRLSLSSTEHGLGTVPNFVKVVIRDGMWRERVIRQTGEPVSFESFEKFVTTPPLKGLGATLAQLRGICRDDPEALDAIDRATQKAPGRPSKKGLNQSNSEDEGRDRSGQQMRRLRKDFPDLHADVLDGALTVHEASVKAGIFPKRMSVPLTVEGATRLLLRLSFEERDEVIARVLKAAS